MNETRSSRKYLCLFLCIIAISFMWFAVNTDKAGAEEKATQKISGEFDHSMEISDEPLALDFKAETELVYESSNSDIAEVSSTGVVTVKRTGAVVIYVTALENEQYRKAEAVVTITVTDYDTYDEENPGFGHWNDSIIWNLDENGTLTLDGCGKLDSVMDCDSFGSPVKKVIIGNRITGIDSDCFSGWSAIESVSIPSSVTSIGREAFSCCNLRSVDIPASVKSIGRGAFSSCDLRSVNILAGVMSIGREAFSYCTYLKSVTIPGSVKVIDKETFSHCDSLKKVTICDGVSEIRDSAFDESPVRYATIPSSVKKIAYSAFNRTGAMTIYGYSGTQAEKYAMGEYDKYDGYSTSCTRFYDLKKKTYKLFKVYVSKTLETPSDYKTIYLYFDQPSATYYELYRASSKNGKYKKIKELKGHSFKDKDRSFNKTYYYKVRACLKISDKKYYSGFTSFTAKSKLPGRTSFSLKTKVKHGKCSNTLKWKKVTGATGYRIYTYNKKKK
mgnify:CR=1 FL=1